MSSSSLPRALSFDDVLIRPAASDFIPNEVQVNTKIAADIELNIPILSAAMDTVTESRLAIAIAQAGGMGVIHRNLSPEQQAREVRRVKKYESGMIINPITITPEKTLAEALALMETKGISGIPVVETQYVDRPGKLVGILTHRDVRFATNMDEPIAYLMTKDNLVTVPQGVSQDEAKAILHRHRIEKLLVVDEHYHCIGLITVKDMEKARAHPNAAKDSAGRLRVGAASSVGDSGFERSEHLVDAGVDMLVIDTAHGHSAHVLEAVKRAKTLSNKVRIIAGNVATKEATKALIDAGADCQCEPRKINARRQRHRYC